MQSASGTLTIICEPDGSQRRWLPLSRRGKIAKIRPARNGPEWITLQLKDDTVMRQFALRTAWTWAVLASLWMSAAPVWAEDDDDRPVGEALLPKETLVFFSFPSVPDCKERMDSSLFGQ